MLFELWGDVGRIPQDRAPVWGPMVKGSVTFAPHAPSLQALIKQKNTSLVTPLHPTMSPHYPLCLTLRYVTR